MLVAVGDLVEDVVVELGGPIQVSSDTATRITRRRGGSAANVAAAAAAGGHRARFVGQVGDDPLGRVLTDDLAGTGAEVVVRRRGRTGSIVVLVDEAGERTMLTDRGAATDLEGPDQGWLTDATALHVPYYSLVVEPLATTCRQLMSWARDGGVLVSVDASSTVLLGPGAADEIAALAPDVVLANADEADRLGDLRDLATTVTVVKQDADPVRLVTADSETAVPAPDLGAVADTTGAGDAFAAGFLTALASGSGRRDAAASGHATAAALLRTRQPGGAPN